jgi:Rrf2 family protein
MHLSKKTVYALRAVFELARRYDSGPITIGAIAEAQTLPVRFLENILIQLKSGGILDSARGREGGYWLARPPGEISVGQVLRIMEMTVAPVDCLEHGLKANCPMKDSCAFLPMWTRGLNAMLAVYDGTSYEDLVREQEALSPNPLPGCARQA